MRGKDIKEMIAPHQEKLNSVLTSGAVVAVVVVASGGDAEVAPAA